VVATTSSRIKCNANRAVIVLIQTKLQAPHGSLTRSSNIIGLQSRRSKQQHRGRRTTTNVSVRAWHRLSLTEVFLREFGRPPNRAAVWPPDLDAVLVTRQGGRHGHRDGGHGGQTTMQALWPVAAAATGRAAAAAANRATGRGRCLRRAEAAGRPLLVGATRDGLNLRANGPGEGGQGRLRSLGTAPTGVARPELITTETAGTVDLFSRPMRVLQS